MDLINVDHDDDLTVLRVHAPTIDLAFTNAGAIDQFWKYFNSVASPIAAGRQTATQVHLEESKTAMWTKISSGAAAMTVAMTMTVGLAHADNHEACDVKAEGMPVAATVSGEVKSLGFLVGARWGTGSLVLKDGTERKFHLVGAKALETGVAVNTFEGEVYNLKSVDDFAGTYYGAAARISIAASKGEGAVNNANCVIIKYRMDGGGLQVSGPAPGGVEVSFTD